MKSLIKRIIASVLLLCILCSFSGCSIGDSLATLGFDTHDYDGEKVIKTYNIDSDIAEKLSDMIRILTINTVEIPEFYGTKEAVDNCRDSILNYLLNSNYSKYTGNLENLEMASKEYPQMRLTVVIPAKEFEDIVYMYFGGKQKISNVSGYMFEYLDRIDSYVTAAQPQKNYIEISTQVIEETENTYRFDFRAVLEDDISDEYHVVFIKRNDGNHYFKYIKKVK